MAEVNLNAVWDVVSRIRMGQAGYAYVVDSLGLLVAHPDISLVLQKRDLSALPQVRAARATGTGAEEAATGAAPAIAVAATAAAEAEAAAAAGSSPAIAACLACRSKRFSNVVRKWSCR